MAKLNGQKAEAEAEAKAVYHEAIKHAKERERRIKKAQTEKAREERRGQTKTRYAGQ